MIRREIQHYIKKAVRRKFPNIDIPEFLVEVPENSEHGDYSTNVAMLLARILKKPPQEVAKILIDNLVLQDFAEVRIASPGFINFWIRAPALHKELLKIFESQDLTILGRKTLSINIEFISANPTGPLTVGNGRGAFLGDALARALKAAGHKVAREYYINDARANTQIQELGRTILKKGESYKGSYTDEIRKRLQKKHFALEKMDEDNAGYLAAREIQKDNKRFIEKVLKVKFDKWYSEEILYRNRLVKKTLDELDRRGFIYQKDGATWFRASQFGDSEDRVALRTGGAPTYFLSDVAYHAEKLGQRKFDLVIDVLGADHHGTFPRVLAGLQALGFEGDRVRAIFTQIVRLVRGGKEIRMSKRKGVFVTLEELIDEVGLDAARYFFLERSPNTHMDFDLALAKERSLKNPVYYIQYAHARMASLFRKAKKRNFQFSIFNFQLLKEAEEVRLIKKLVQFPEVVEDAAGDYQVHRLTRYAYELANLFHNFYERHRVIGDDKELTRARIVLVKATKVVLKRALDLLGISAPTKM